MVSEQEAQLLKSYVSGQIPVRPKRGGCLGCLPKLLGIAIFGLAVFYGVMAITDPWAFHIGGRLTPFLTWHGYGQLQTKDGNRYPLYVSFYPSSHFSQLRREGLRPTGGLQGYGWLCAAPGVSQRLDLSGTIYGGWRSTDGSLMAFRLLEWRTTRDRLLGTAPNRGYIDLSGRWHGSQLLVNQDFATPFRSGLRFDHASVTLDWGTYSAFKELCAKMTKSTAGP